MTPIQASLKVNEGCAHENLLDRRKKIKPKFQASDLVRKTYLKKTFSKSVSTGLTNHMIAHNNKDTTPSYQIDNLPKKNETLLKETELTLKKKIVWKP